MANKKQTLYLPCKLTREEIHEQSKKLANALKEKLAIESQIDSFKAQMKAKVAEFDSVIQLSSNMVDSETEWRNIECTIEYDWKKGFKTFFRTDTGEQCRQENVSAEERQAQFDFEEDQRRQEEAEAALKAVEKGNGKKKNADD